VEVGAGSVSEKSEEFGQYNGLHEKGGFLIGEGTLRSRGGRRAYWNLDAGRKLGLDTRAVDAEGGSRAAYKLRFKYDESIHRHLGQRADALRGSGGARADLARAFVKAGTDGCNDQPAGSLQSVELGTQRKLLAWRRAGTAAARGNTR